MKRKSMPEERKNGVRRKTAGRLCGLLIAAMLAGGMSSGKIADTYAAQNAGREIGMPASDADEEADLPPAPTQEPTEETEDTTPTPVPKKTPTPSPTPEEPEPAVTEGAEPTKEGGGAEGEEGATPTPTKKPKKTPTPTPASEEPEPTVTEGAEPTKAEGEEDATPTPTKKPKKTPTPTPALEESEPTVTEGAEPTKAEGEDATPTPTKKPSKTPSWAVPTESDDARYQYLLGINSKVITIDNPPVGYKSAAEAAKNMKTITIPVWKMTASGGKYASSAQLTINKKLAKNVQQIFKEIFDLELKFPIKVIRGYMYRKVGGVGLSKSRIMSIHSFGAAIDINPGDYDNDYFLGKGNDLRDKSNPYCIPDEVIAIFEKYGWFWGGNFEICADTMHFQYFELGMLTYQGNSPFRTLKVKSGYMSGTDVRNLQQRLRELGFYVSVDGVYGSKTANAVEKYQKSRGLEATGEVDYKTWETIINETHYMAYVF